MPDYDWNGVARLPAPWQLTGQAYVLLYRFPRRFLSQAGGYPPSMAESFQGGLGSVMLVDYEHSPAGPYSELLFIPGRFALAGGRPYSITTIFVSTMVSLRSGRENWGIPKEQASFLFRDEDESTRTVTVTVGSDRVMEIRLQAGWFRFWAGTLWWPVPLGQVLDGKTFLTRLHGRGIIRPAKVLEMSVDSRFFPDVSALQPLMVVRVDNLRLGFGAPVIREPGQAGELRR
ncbi:MAG TPA: hypothetical protein VMW83_02575 [Spirochaetia bacterium]|nr:hypothetical protein [Spirochaetia bacterium]